MKRFYLTHKHTIINFSSMLCDSELKIITSKTFEYVLAQFMRTKRKQQDPLVLELKSVTPKMILEAYKLLLLWSYEELSRKETNLSYLLSKRDTFYRFTEAFYDYWRDLERYGIIMGDKHATKNFKSRELVAISEQFNNRILYLYRTIAEKIMKRSYLTYRQLPAGVNASLILYPHRYSRIPTYESIQGFYFVQQTLIRPPFMIYSGANTRQGIFQETKENPLSYLSLNRTDYIVYPIWVGKLLAFVYIHVDYLHHGIALSNLFELASYEEYQNRKPDLMMVYGGGEHKANLHYYKDIENRIYMGFVSLNRNYDYFGYLKKMLLTLHNVYSIDENKLPIHGSMVNILLRNGMQKNIIVVGDSGAGKSETLEALRVIGEDDIKDMRVVFDDMGLLYLYNHQIVATGTETGAFVRLDDLESGYAYREIDRAIFLNPDQTNARVVLPVNNYSFISKNHPVDLFLYANNYDDNKGDFSIFKNMDDALNVFKEGKRKAKGTTAEIGLVKSFFANPFGPVQQREDTEKLINQCFAEMFKQQIDIGILYTKLAVTGKENDGPKNASKALLSYLLETKRRD